MRLHGKVAFGFDGEPFVAQITKVAEAGYSFTSLDERRPFEGQLRFGGEHTASDASTVTASAEFSYLGADDMVRFNPRSGEMRVLYRSTSRHNFLFFTERCNSRCLMCSQPPREIDDGYLVDDILRMIPKMSKETAELGITGGEPTLLGARFIDVVRSTEQHLPRTALHVLTNGRLLSYLRYAEQIAAVAHPDLMLGIPLYADTFEAHDYVVQARGAFDQTLRGILNLARVGVRIEIRVVIHHETFRRLPQLAQFIVRNLPFVEQVALMGLEVTGYARSNLSSLWIDPVDYQAELAEAVSILDGASIKTSIYNHQLCVLPPRLRPFAKRSISDWKRTYLPICEGCGLKSDCGGFFETSGGRFSRSIRAIS